MINFIRKNKLISVVVGVLFTSVISYQVLWSTWVTNKIFCQEKSMNSHIAVQEKEEKATTKQLKEVKEDIAQLRRESREDNLLLRKDVVDNQKELLKLLIEIKREGKK